jgi:hypothetical protein
MERKEVSGGSMVEEKTAHSKAVDGESFVFVAGTTGENGGSITIADDVVQWAGQYS